MNLVESLKQSLLEGEDAKIKELEKKIDKVEDKAEKAEDKADKAEDKAEKADSKGEETIKDEKSFRAAAKAKFEEVFGDDLDEKRMKDTIDGLLKDNSELVEKGEWAKLIGMLNQSFGK